MALEQLQFLEQQISQLDQELASLLRPLQDTVHCGRAGARSRFSAAHHCQLGPVAATFPPEKCLSSWVGACPGNEESAGVNYSYRSPQGNHMQSILNQAANAAARTKGSILRDCLSPIAPASGT